MWTLCFVTKQNFSSYRQLPSTGAYQPTSPSLRGIFFFLRRGLQLRNDTLTGNCSKFTCGVVCQVAHSEVTLEHAKLGTERSSRPLRSRCVVFEVARFVRLHRASHGGERCTVRIVSALALRIAQFFQPALF